MKKIFVIDWILLAVFILSAYSGVELHIAGHDGSHEVWHNWAVFHVLASLLSLVAVIFHLTTHWGWYKGITKHGIGKKSKVTIVLSVAFVFLSVTGIVLLGVSGSNTSVGLWHYKTGIITSVIAVGHTLKRIPVLRKSIKKQL